MDNYDLVSKWAKNINLQKTVASQKFVVMDNFFPDHIAQAALSIIETNTDWNVTSASENYQQNNISHNFVSTKAANNPNLALVLRLMQALIPDSLSTFSAARYLQGDHIARHDDRQYTQVKMENGEEVLCSRTIAVIVYLTPGWKKSMGGICKDLEGNQNVVPKFNRAVAFSIPHWHEVTKVVGDLPRYSIFGWFLKEGKLYDLQTS